MEWINEALAYFRSKFPNCRFGYDTENGEMVFSMYLTVIPKAITTAEQLAHTSNGATIETLEFVFDTDEEKALTLNQFIVEFEPEATKFIKSFE